MESWSAWFTMAATGEFTRRHAGKGGRHEFASDELADELNLTWQSAAGQMDYACTVADRLPRCFAALRAGKLHPVDLRIIEDETRILSSADAAKADEILAGMAGRPPAPDPGPERAMHRGRMRAPSRTMRPGSHDRLGPRRDHLRV